MPNQPVPARSNPTRPPRSLSVHFKTEVPVRLEKKDAKLNDDPHDPKWLAKPAGAPPSKTSSHEHVLTEAGYKKIHEQDHHSVWHHPEHGYAVHDRGGSDSHPKGPVTHTHSTNEGHTVHAHQWDLDAHLGGGDDK